MVYLNLNKKEFSEKKQEEYNKTAISETGEEGKDDLRIDDDGKSKVYIEEIRDGKMTIVAETNVGYISIDVIIDDDHIISMAEMLVKKLNKLKTALESLK